MKLKVFLDHPVLSIVLSILIVIVGIFSIISLPIEQYPDMAPPTINVSANYPGASAETVQKSVIVPLEQAINGVENMTYITSSASNNGEATITVFFDQKSNADMDAVNVQNSVQAALSLLPADVTKYGVTTSKQQNSQLRTFALYTENDSYGKQFLDNYLSINIIPRIKRIKGVGQVMSFGSDYSIRVWMDPAKMSQYKLIPSDINNALAQQNIESSTGSFGENHDNVYEYTMKYRGRFSKPEEFGNIVIRTNDDGELLRLKDVARVELGDAAYNFGCHLNGHQASLAMVYQTAGSNASEINNKIDQTIEELSKDLPKDVKIISMSDSNQFLKASIHNVIETLFEAILLVIIVVLVFLQDIRSTIIPSISIIVSIIGTFAFLHIAGFSVNLLTLFALVLAIGTVVDDAIIVVEAVHERFDRGYTSSYLATHDAMGSISGAVFTSTLIFMAVFIPVSFINGTSGMFFRQFGLTMAAAVGISGFNAFTLTPALCALLLKPHSQLNDTDTKGFKTRFKMSFNTIFRKMSNKYLDGVMLVIKKRWILWSTLAASVILLLVMVQRTPTGLVPDEDQGYAFLSLNMKPGTSLTETSKLLASMDKELAKIPEIEYRSDVSGYSFSGAGPSMGMYIITLKPWDQRKGKEHSVESVINRLYGLSAKFPEASIFMMMPPMISGYGQSSGFELNLQDMAGSKIEDLKAVSDKFVAALSKRKEIGQAYSSFDINYPQYWVDVDAAQCAKAGVQPSDVLETISGYYSGSYASNFNRFTRLYRVMTQAEPDSRVTPESFNNIYVRVGNGDMAPVTRFARLTKTKGPQNLDRFNLFNAISISGTPAAGYSSGDAIKAIKEVASKVLPRNYGYEFGGITREESQTTNNTIIIFAVCIVLVYLVMSSLYDSFILPFAVLLSIPVGLFGSFLAAQIFGLQNNVYMQTGMIMLIGLLAKTAVLITDYARKRRQAGMRLTQAAYHAARARFRPILMTVLAMVFGLLPLMFASGVGANGSRSLASGVVGGVVIGTLSLILFTPVLFIIFEWIQEKIKPTQSSRKEADWEIQDEMEILDKTEKK